MNYDLKEVFNAITPDSIKNVPVINDMMNIFIDVLEQRSKQSIDIGTYMENREIRKELFKTYLSDLYEVLDGIKSNQKIIDLISSRNSIYGSSENYEFISREVVNDMINRISDEHFVAFKNFREKKGTIKAIEYIFHLIATLVNLPTSIDYIIIEGENPFELKIEGTLPHEFYYYLIAPLAHPAGFTYQYFQAISWELIDYFFPISIQYKVNKLIVNCVSKHPDNPDLEIKNSTDFSDREVINVVENSYVWPKSTKIYFGGEYEGEYLENLIYADGNSTVILYDSEGHGTKFGDYCTIDKDIEVIIIEDPICNQLLTDVYSFFETKYTWNYNPETGEYEEDEDILSDDISFDESVSNTKTPYISWERIPFWSIVGSWPYKWDNWNNGCYPDKFYESRTSKEDDDALHVIGAEHMYVWGKHEVIGDQFLNEFIGEIPNRDHENLYGKTKYKGRDTILTKPGDLEFEAYIEGDAFHMTYMSDIPKIGHFIIQDNVGAHIIPDAFETTNGFGLDENGLNNADETIRFNSFIYRDDEYSVLFLDDLDESKKYNQFILDKIKISPFSYLIGEFNVNQLNRVRISTCGTVKYGQETGVETIKVGEYRVKFDYWNIGDYTSFSYRSPYRNDKFHKAKNVSTFYVGYSSVGDFLEEITPGFWNNGFHQESDKLEFQVFRDDKLVLDNNTNLPLITSLDDDDYSLSGNDVVFSEYSDEFFIQNLRDGEEVNTNIQTREISFDSKYSNSWKLSDSKYEEFEHFNENSDKLNFYESYNLNDDYSLSNNVVVFDEYSDEFLIRNLRGNEEVNTNIQVREISFDSKYSNSWKLSDSKYEEFEHFNENSDKLDFSVSYKTKDDYSILFYENIGNNLVGELQVAKFSVYPDTSYNIGFGENSDNLDSFDVDEI